MGSTQRFPVSSKKLYLDIKGNKTDIVISAYDDYFLVIVTQIGTMGTILHARKEAGMSIHPTFNVSVIFGKRDEPMLVACARQLIEHIKWLWLPQVVSPLSWSEGSLHGDGERDCFSRQRKPAMLMNLPTDINFCFQSPISLAKRSYYSDRMLPTHGNSFPLLTSNRKIGLKWTVEISLQISGCLWMSGL